MVPNKNVRFIAKIISTSTLMPKDLADREETTTIKLERLSRNKKTWVSGHDKPKGYKNFNGAYKEFQRQVGAQILGDEYNIFLRVYSFEKFWWLDGQAVINGETEKII